MKPQKSIYDAVVRQPRLFEEEDMFYYAYQHNLAAESQKYKYYMDRAFIEIDRMQRELQEAKIEAYNAARMRQEKDEQINKLSQRFKDQERYQQQQLEALKRQQNEYAERCRAYFNELQQQKEEALRKRKVTAANLEDDPTLLSDDAKELLIKAAQQEILKQQQYLIQTLQNTENIVFPMTFRECYERFGLVNPLLNANDDFCQAEDGKLTEVILNYYKIKNLEMQIMVQNEVLEKVYRINIREAHHSGIYDDDYKDIDVSDIGK